MNTSIKNTDFTFKEQFITVVIMGAITALFYFALTARDSEHDKQWDEWRAKAENIPYRCGMFGPYEFRVDRKYLFFWPSYEGRSDWEVKGPPPITCDAKLSSIRLETRWPGLTPAGASPVETPATSDQISVTLNSVLPRDHWDLNNLLRGKLNINNGATATLRTYEKDLALNHASGKNSVFKDLESDYYWVSEPDGRISTFVECSQLSKEYNRCDMTFFIPYMSVAARINFPASSLYSWRYIQQDAILLINQLAIYKGN